MWRKNLFIIAMVWMLGAGLAQAQRAVEKILPMDGQITAEGRAIELSWFDAEPPRVGSVTVKRRRYGQIGGGTWQTIADALGPVMRYTDETIQPGTAYEYQVIRTARDIIDVGYWIAGTQIPAQHSRGTAHLVVDETIAEDLAPRLARFTRDLTGDGWRVQRYRVPRGKPGKAGKTPAQLEAAAQIKAALQSNYAADPFGGHAVILIGHVPIVRSGAVNPDGHNSVPHATDLFYADMDGRWHANNAGILQNNRIPGDFIEVQIGRIDFYNQAVQDRDLELRLLRAYFDKNHHWRMALREKGFETAYGSSNHLKVERAGLRNIVGPQAIDTRIDQDLANHTPWLWGVYFGGFNSNTAGRAVFALTFGSGIQMFQNRGNPMTALLAHSWNTLAVGWGGRPAWWVHHMALGGSIGDVHMRTVNNGEAEKPYRETMDYFPTGAYLMRNGIWVNLLGDPTARAFILAPPLKVTASRQDQSMNLSWTASKDPDTLGYKVYREDPATGEFSPLANGRLTDDLSFSDDDAPEGAMYMVRAYGLKTVYAGTFYTYSQGVFATENALSETDIAPDIALSTTQGQPVALPASFHQVAEGKITAPIHGPRIGTLQQDADGWRYIPPAGFQGTVSLPFSVSHGLHTAVGTLTISVGAAP